jgi:hypothetical protein
LEAEASAGTTGETLLLVSPVKAKPCTAFRAAMARRSAPVSCFVVGGALPLVLFSSPIAASDKRARAAASDSNTKPELARALASAKLAIATDERDCAPSAAAADAAPASAARAASSSSALAATTSSSSATAWATTDRGSATRRARCGRVCVWMGLVAREVVRPVTLAPATATAMDDVMDEVMDEVIIFGMFDSQKAGFTEETDLIYPRDVESRLGEGGNETGRVVG